MWANPAKGTGLLDVSEGPRQRPSVLDVGGDSVCDAGGAADGGFNAEVARTERRRARLACRCSVGGETVLDGEALVKVPTKAEADPLANRTERAQG